MYMYRGTSYSVLVIEMKTSQSVSDGQVLCVIILIYGLVLLLLVKGHTN